MAAMYDDDSSRRYDVPHEGEIDFGSEPSGAGAIIGGAIDFLKGNWLKIVAVIVLIGIAYFAYDFLVGSFRTVSITALSTEGQTISGATIRVFDSGGKEIERINSGDTLSLKDGSYTVTVNASGFKALRSYPIEVKGNTEISLKLEENVDISLSGEFPEKLLSGEKKIVTVTVTNNESTPQAIEFVFEGALDSKRMSFSYPKPLTVPPGQFTAELELQVREDLASSLFGENLSGKIRIKGQDNPNAIINASFALIQFDSRKMEVSPRGTMRLTTFEGGIAQQTIRVKNKNPNKMEDIQLRVEINSAKYSTTEDAASWFSLDQETISLNENEEKSIVLRVNPPAGIQIPSDATEEKVGGKVVISTSYWSTEILIDLTIDKTSLKLEITGANDKIVRKNPDSGDYQEEDFDLTLQNRGELTIREVIVTVSCNSSIGDVDWVNINRTNFDEIPPRESVSTVYLINAAGYAEGLIATCELSARYSGPTAGEREETIKEFTITTG
ncbi:MAG: hypothetical protein QT03_C0001G0035 [archaeon GW2011_AR10]|uniref:Carboxypeptidase regulatory-like domain-containing protein n=2 Tax=Candidatus Iainarchaeum sp. TaxID=3101447 RepID=A0A7J4IZ52_9ARCH|nr:MAG: hypothetical protein QT03_C0001G0035 [archaeon GW2011_AR10]HIH08246.1 carboxypeptidase regulatory-like domain-containing protein [Candidatus Diapherotrites archaeon]